MRRVRRAGMLALVVWLSACGDGSDSFSPTAENVAGTYTATVFTLTSSIGTTDLLALGATVTVTLDPAGTTTGQLFVPGGAEDGGDLNADLAGTWTLTGSTVRFSQSTDTFIRDVPFTAGPDRLSSEGDFEAGRIRLVLGKTG